MAAKKHSAPAKKRKATVSKKDSLSARASAAIRLAVHEGDPTPLPNALALFKPAWQAMLLNLMETAKLFALPLVPLVMAWLCLAVAFRHQGTTMQAVFNGLGAVSLLVALGLLFVVMPAYARIQLRSAREEVADFREEFLDGLPVFWRYLGVNILLFLMVAGGLLLFIIPGLYAYQRYMNAPFYILERDMSIRAALHASAQDARLYSRAMWGLVGVTIILRSVSVLSFNALILLGIVAVMQFIYNYAQAIRYVEIVESRREITLGEKRHLRRSRHPRTANS